MIKKSLTTLRSLIGRLIIVLALTTNSLYAQQGQRPGTPADDTGKLIDLLYTVEDFTNRLERAVDQHPLIQQFGQERLYLQSMLEEVRASALSRYGQSINEAYGELSTQEIASLIVLMESDNGELVRKLLRAEQFGIAPALTDYINDLHAHAVAALVAYDSVLYHREFTYDLRELMEGDYYQPAPNSTPSTLERRQDIQIERMKGMEYRFGVDWKSNSSYILSDMEGNPVALGPPLKINVYGIEQDTFRYIYQFLNGSYGKDVMIKTSYTSPEQRACTYQYGLWEHYVRPESSPLPMDSLDGFRERGGLQFYPIDATYRVTADVVPDTSGATLTLPTSAGTEVTYGVYGTARFLLDGKPQTLTLYQPQSSAGDQRLFLPFRDGTSGESTYGGGRYLDLPLPEAGRLELDFNLAYHPYCAYTAGYACPVPPEENRLSVAVEAGVRMGE